MTAESDNIQLVSAALEAADNGDLDACRTYMHHDLVVTIAGVPTPIEGREHWLGGVSEMATAFPDLRTVIDDAIATDNTVAVRCTITGTHQSPFQGIDATGRPIKIMSNDFYRIEHGQVVQAWIVTDTSSLFAQIS